jgi:UDP-GlcNAc:undecaprenyl-phosphate GlcNAc-1-phosphate transferase
MILSLVLMASGSFVLSLFMEALILSVCRKMAWYDRTNMRKIHSGNIPRLGGIGFVFSFIIFFVVVGFFLKVFSFEFKFLPIALAYVLILISGIRDDFKPMVPRHKLILHTCAALCVLISGHVFERFFFIDHVDFLEFSGWNLLSYPLTLLWIVGITNAVNFVDGVDGLAGGISLLALLSFGAIFAALGTGGVTFLFCACLVSALLGFLVFNAPFPRAKIFMGDGGAYFLGFTLALFPLMGAGDAAAGLPVFHAAAILLIPILDTTAAVWRRLRDGKRIGSPDRCHTHHKLMNLGLSSRRIDAVLFTLQFCLGIMVYVAVKIPGYLSLVVLFLTYAAGTGFFAALHFLNRQKMAAIRGSAQVKVPRGARVA